MIITNIVGIIADDLTGANDTALQFQKRGAKTKILLDYNDVPQNDSNTEVWAISTESRNINSTEAKLRAGNTLKNLDQNLDLEFFYKKIDSTLRGHIAVETLELINILEYDAAIIIPAFPSEGRITVGGYHLSKGVPISRTEMATDPHCPVTESHIPTFFASKLDEEEKCLIGSIGLSTVINGAGPILVKINELIKEGKRLIIADATSVTDIEQIVLAITKSSYKILPAGTAATGSVLAKTWLPELEIDETEKIAIPKQPRLIISGSATGINANQIEQLEKSYDYEVCSLALTTDAVFNNKIDEYENKVLSMLENNNTVLVHSSRLLDDFDGFSEESLKDELTRAKFSTKITDFLAELTKRIIEKKKVLLITLGGETSYKCCSAISSKELTMLDEAAPAIALCKDFKDQFIITKSGNLGNPNTLIEIMNYIEKHEQIQE